MTLLSNRGLIRPVAVLLGLCTAAFAADQPPKLRLSEVEKVRPTSYSADLTLDPTKDTFSGSITIKVDVQQATSTIWLNQEKLTLNSATFTSGGKSLTAKTLPGGDDFVGLQFPSPVPTGAAEIKISYSGQVIAKNSSGIFRQEDNGNWYNFTQFEPTDARAAFPCFDEPEYKTPWQLTLRIPTGDTAVSNTGIESEKNEGGMKTVVFHQTKPLPSYLVAFGVGPFEYVDAGKTGKNQAPVRIVVPKGHAAEAKYAAEVTAPILSRLEEYFGIPFPYEKSDQVVIPNTSGFGAMENPGMVTYAQNILLGKPETDTINRQRTYATVAAHELAHQWFGDLVTTSWWNDIWLNEAFATWMEMKLIAEWKPEWKTRVGDVGSKLGAESEDSLITARKVRQPIEAKDDINNAFDGITYQKGAAVIGMFEHWMGPKDFQKGVQNYMKQYAFKATTAGDFLDSLSSTGHPDITKSFSTFLNQAGVPLVSMSLNCDKGAPTLHLEQQRSLPMGSKGSADQTWSIPICVRYGSGDTGTGECMLMTQPKQDMPLKAKSCPAWVDGNDQAVGYYRVDYQGKMLSALTTGDVQKRLSAPERADLMGNAQALSSTGKLPAADALKLVEVFHTDSERQVLSGALQLALQPRAYLVPANMMPAYQNFLQRNFDAKARELGWTPKPGESDDVRLLRPSIVRALATWGGDQQLAAEAKQLTEKWFQNHKALDPNMVNATLGTAAFYGDKALFDRFLAEFKKTQDKQTHGQIVAAMGEFRDKPSISASMQAVASGEIPFMEGDRLLFSGQGDPTTRKMALDFLKANFDSITTKMPTGGGFDFGSVLPNVGASYCDEQSKQELSSFFQPRVDKFVGAPRSLSQVLESIDLCTTRVKNQQPSVVQFLQAYSK